MPGSDERRNELRVNLPIQVWFNVLGSQEEYLRGHSVATLRLAPAARSEPEITGKDELERFLLRLDQKLDFVISLLTDKLGRKKYRHKGVVVDVSENGLRTNSPIPLEIGAALEIGLVLPHMPYRVMDIAADVVWKQDAAPKDGPFLVGLKFVNVLPQDQDEIVHWIFQKQREEIRARRGEE